MFQLFRKSKESRARLDTIMAGAEPPTFRAGLMRALEVLRDPDSENPAIAAALNWEPGLVVRLLRTANSAAYGLRNPVDSVQHAVAVLGRARLEQLVLAVAVKDTLPMPEVPGFEASRYWTCAFFRAALARAIAERVHPASQEVSFTAGLLQDMAIPILARARPEYGPVLEAWHGAPDSALHELEQREFGWSHDEAGGLLAAEWELPERISKAIQLHHDDTVGDDELLPALRLVAVHRETEAELGIEALLEDGRSLYGLAPDWLAAAVETSMEQARQLSRRL